MALIFVTLAESDMVVSAIPSCATLSRKKPAKSSFARQVILLMISLLQGDSEIYSPFLEVPVLWFTNKSNFSLGNKTVFGIAVSRIKRPYQ